MLRLVHTLERYAGTQAQFGPHDRADRLPDRESLIAQLDVDAITTRGVLRLWIAMNAIGGAILLGLLLFGTVDPLFGLPFGTVVLALMLRRVERVLREHRLQVVALRMALACTDEKTLHSIMLTFAVALMPTPAGQQAEHEMDGRAAKVFISYNSRDEAIALQLRDDLREAGGLAWLDKIDGNPGDLVADRLRTGLAESTCVVQMLTPNSVESPWVLQEALWARDQRLRVVQVIAASCRIPTALDNAIRAHVFVDLTRSNRSVEYRRLLRLLCAATSAR